MLLGSRFIKEGKVNSNILGNKVK